MPAVALGPQFVVNAYTAFKQYRPFATALSTGGFVIGWQDESGTDVPVGSQDDVRFARYDGFGTRQSAGIDTLANTTTPASQFEGSAAGFADGKYVIVWTDASGTPPDIDNRSVRGQVFNANGTKSGSEFIVNSTFTDSQTQPSVTVLNSGRFAVTWTSGIGDDSGATDIISRVFNADGTPFTAETTVNTQTVGNQDKSTVQALSTGGFAVVWSDREESPVTGDQTKTFIRFFSPGGSAISTPLLANSTAAGDPQDIDIAELTDGRLVIVYADYETATSDGSGAAVRARIYNPATSTFGATINVNTITSGDQLDAQVAALDNGQFVVVWTDASTSGDDPSFTAVRMQVFSATGAKSGGEVLVATTKVFEQQNPVVTVLKDFRFVVAWEDNSQEGTDIDSFSIRSRMYDARIAPIDIDGGNASDSFQGSSFGDTIEGLGGADVIRGGNGSDFIFGGIGIDGLFGDDGNDELDGNDQNDTLDGGAGNDTLDGGTGNDTMKGGIGNDIYYVDSISDIVTELPNQGYDTVRTTLATYTLAANVERLYNDSTSAFTAVGNSLDNTNYGNNGDDKFRDYAGGADAYSGGNGVDSMYYSGTTAAILNFATGVHGGSAAGDAFASVEKFFGSSTGNDQMIAGAARATFNGQAGNDTLTGGANHDKLYGEAGIDILSGGGGNDQLFGGAQNDTMTGGALADYFIYTETKASGGWGIDTITDWQSGLDILRFASTTGATSTINFAFIPNSPTQFTLILPGPVESRIIVQSATPFTLTSADFDFY
jgi:Ca2+-binding RTX toxin-like protein